MIRKAGAGEKPDLSSVLSHLAPAAMGKKPGKHIDLSPDKLQEKLNHGHYSIISAGRSASDPKEKDLPWDHPIFKERHEKLRQDLIHHGYDHTEIHGKYGAPEMSFIVHHKPELPSPVGYQKAFMVHHKSTSEHESIRKLGKKYNQESVIHSKGGQNEMHFVTGQHAGTHHKGEGHELKPAADDYYSEVSHPSGSKTKFALNFHWGEHHPQDKAVLKAMVPESEQPQGEPEPTAESEPTGEEDEGSQYIHHVTADPPDRFPHEVEFSRWLHSHPIHESEHEWNAVRSMGGFKDLHVPASEEEDDEYSSAEPDRPGSEGVTSDQESGSTEKEPEDYSYLDSYQHGDRTSAEK